MNDKIFYVLEIQKNGQWISSGLTAECYNDLIVQSTAWLNEKGNPPHRVIQHLNKSPHQLLKPGFRCC